MVRQCMVSLELHPVFLKLLSFERTWVGGVAFGREGWRIDGVTRAEVEALRAELERERLRANQAQTMGDLAGARPWQWQAGNDGVSQGRFPGGGG